MLAKKCPTCGGKGRIDPPEPPAPSFPARVFRAPDPPPPDAGPCGKCAAAGYVPDGVISINDLRRRLGGPATLEDSGKTTE